MDIKENNIISLKGRAVTVLSEFNTSNHVTLDSQALCVMTDFYEKIPAIIEPEFTADEAFAKIKREQVNSLLVLNRQNEFLGIISSNSLNDNHTLEYMSKHGVKNRKEVTVADLMIHKDSMQAIEYMTLREKNFKVADVIAALSKFHLRHLLVVSIPSNNPDITEVVGIISASNIAKLLQLNFEPNLENVTFSSLQKYMNI